MKYKLLALDLDGTLTNTKKKLLLTHDGLLLKLNKKE